MGWADLTSAGEKEVQGHAIGNIIIKII